MTFRRGVGSIAIVALVVGAFAACFALARSSRATTHQAAAVRAFGWSSAYGHTRLPALGKGRSTGYQAGTKAGDAAGDRAGVHAGTRAGRKVLAKRQAAAAAAAAKTRARSCPGGLVPQGAAACVIPGTAAVGGQSAGCGGNPYATPTRSGGCIGPAAPPSAANAGPATSCPAGQVPVGSAGACAPRSGGQNSPGISSGAGAPNGGGNLPTCTYERGYSSCSSLP